MHTSGQSNQAASGKGKTMANNEFNWGEGLFMTGQATGEKSVKKTRIKTRWDYRARRPA